MDFLSKLESLGVNVNEGLDRVMGDKDLYLMMLDMFVSAVRDTPIQPEEFDGSNLEDLIARVHTLKGTTGNLSITPLFTQYTNTLTLLREGRPAEAKAAYIKLLSVQADILACIQQH